MTYPGLKAVASQKGIVVHPLEMDADGIVPDGFQTLCQERPPKALYVIPNMDNPTTATLPEDSRQALTAIGRKHGVTIAEDDPIAAKLAEDAKRYTAIQEQMEKALEPIAASRIV